MGLLLNLLAFVWHALNLRIEIINWILLWLKCLECFCFWLSTFLPDHLIGLDHAALFSLVIDMALVWIFANSKIVRQSSRACLWDKFLSIIKRLKILHVKTWCIRWLFYCVIYAWGPAWKFALQIYIDLKRSLGPSLIKIELIQRSPKSHIFARFD